MRLYEQEKEYSLLFRVRYIQLLVRNPLRDQDGIWDKFRRLAKLSMAYLEIEFNLGLDSGSFHAIDRRLAGYYALFNRCSAGKTAIAAGGMKP